MKSATATFANYTSYDKGLTGIIVDVTGTLSGFSASDITLKTGNDNNPAAWPTVTDATIAMRMIPGGGGTRIDITIPAGEVVDAWLQVTIASTHTQLTGSDQFYFGNAPGESGDNAANAQVGAVDEIGARAFAANLATQSNAAAITNIYDYNRDKTVSPLDEAVAGAHYTNFITALKLITTPAGPLALPADTQAGTPADAPVGVPADSEGASGTGGTATPSAAVQANAARAAPAPAVIPPPPALLPTTPAPVGASAPVPAVILSEASPVVVNVAPVAGKQKKGTPKPAPLHVPRVNVLKRSGFAKVFELLAARFGKL